MLQVHRSRSEDNLQESVIFHHDIKPIRWAASAFSCVAFICIGRVDSVVVCRPEIAGSAVPVLGEPCLALLPGLPLSLHRKFLVGAASSSLLLSLFLPSQPGSFSFCCCLQLFVILWSFCMYSVPLFCACFLS